VETLGQKMKDPISKVEKALMISDEILNNFEISDLTFEKILLKCKKLARLRDDFDAINWFTAELRGYGQNVDIIGISRQDFDRYAELSGRYSVSIDPLTKKSSRKYWTASVSEIEADIQTNLISLENLRPPAQFTPAINKHSYNSSFSGPTSSEHVIEKYQDVLNALNQKKQSISDQIKLYRSLLSKIKSCVYNYVLNINLQLRFESVTETIFQETKVGVDKKLSKICPDAIKKFIAAYDRLNSENAEEWSQAMSSCRNVLKEFADYVFPAQKNQYKKKNGENLIVTDDKYKNRIFAFIDKNTIGDKNKFLTSRTADLECRIHILNDLLSKGTHVGLDLQDVRICVLDTYLLIGSLLGITQE
jgi:hypothetical protein